MTNGDFNATLTIDNRLFSEEGRGEIKKDLEQSIEIGKLLLPKVWASPNTALGLAYGGVGYLYGNLTNQDVKVSIGNNAVQFEGNPLGFDGTAMTLGNAINYFGSARPDSGKTLSYSKGYYTYNYNANNNGRLPNDADRIILGDHEQVHTYQAEKLGPLFLPTYFFGGGINKNNLLEQNADKVGNNAYLKWKYESK